MSTVDNPTTTERFEQPTEDFKDPNVTEQNLTASSERPAEMAFELEDTVVDSTQVLLKPPKEILAELPTSRNEKPVVEGAEPPDAHVEENQEIPPTLKTGNEGGGKPPEPPMPTPEFEEEDPEPGPRRTPPVVKSADISEVAKPPHEEQPSKLPPEASIASASIARQARVEPPAAEEKTEQTPTPSTRPIDARPEKENLQQKPIQPPKAKKETTSVHYEQNGVYLNKNPDAIAEEISEDMRLKAESNAAQFREYVDNAPNLNDKYADEIATVKSQFEEDGLDLAPIVVLDAEQFAEIRELVVDNDEREFYGSYASERVVLIEPPRQIQEIFGSTYMLGNMLHEGGHSSGGESKSIVVSRVLPNEDGSGYKRYIRSAGGLSGFRKYKFEGDSIEIIGDFIEESFAGLLRVRGLERLDKVPHVEGFQILREGIRYLGENTIPNKGDEQLTMPLKFITAAVLKGQIAVYGDVSHVGAYGLTLLDEARPGLFEQMKLSRRDPTKHHEVIKTINSIKPGLYRELRELSYNYDDFIQGVKIIQAAIAESNANQAK
jgi:hypothetical protein